MDSKLVLAVILILVGLVSLGIGLYQIVYASNEANYDPSDLVSDIRKLRELPFTSPIEKIGNKENPTHVEYKLLFTTDDVFSVDNRIDYAIQAKVIGPNVVKRIAFFIDSGVLNYSDVDAKSVGPTIDQEKEKDAAIELNELNDEFFETENIIICKEDSKLYFAYNPAFCEEDESPKPYPVKYFLGTSFVTFPKSFTVSLFPVLLEKDGTYHAFTYAGNLFDILPAYTKVQADTNKALIENIQTQRRINDTIIGLSLIVVAGIPIAIGTQILLVKKSS